jgi:hypothetical protein
MCVLILTQQDREENMLRVHNWERYFKPWVTQATKYSAVLQFVNYNLIDIKRARRKIQQIICVVQYDICYYVA